MPKNKLFQKSEEEKMQYNRINDSKDLKELFKRNTFLIQNNRCLFSYTKVQRTEDKDTSNNLELYFDLNVVVTQIKIKYFLEGHITVMQQLSK